MTGVVIQFKLEGAEQVKKEIQGISGELSNASKAANDASMGGVASFTRGLEGAGKALQSFGSGLSSFGSKMTVGVSLPLAAIGAALFKVGADAVESENLFKVAMGDMEESARAFSVKMREQLGLNEFEMRKNIGTVFQMTTSMGVNREAALGMSEGVAVLAQDMASFFNLKPDEAFQKLTAGITGEVEPLKRLGIVVSENTIKQTAMTHGLIKQGDTMTEQQKVIARYLTIVDQTKNAQGDLARTMDSPTNQLRIMTGQFRQTAIELGQALLPGFQRLMTDALKPLVNLFANVTAAFKKLSPETQVLIVGIGAAAIAFGPLVKAMGLMINLSGLMLGAKGLAGLVTFIVGGAWKGAITSIIAMAAPVLALAAAFTAAFSAGRFLVNWLDSDSMAEAFQKTKDDLADVGAQVKDTVGSMVSSVQEKMGKLFETPDGKSPTEEIGKDTKALSDEIKALMAGSADAARESFGDIVKDSDKAEKAQIASLERIRRARERADDVHRQLAESGAELHQAIASDQIRDIERVAEYDIDAQYRMLQAELAHYETMGAEGAAAADLVKSKMAELGDQIQHRTFGQGVRDAINEFIAVTGDLGAVARNIVGGAFSSLTDTISNFIQTGKLKFGDFVDFLKAAIADFIASAIVRKFVQVIAGGFGLTVPGIAVGSGTGSGTGTGTGVTIPGTGGGSVSVGGTTYGYKGGTFTGGFFDKVVEMPGIGGIGTVGELLGAAGAGFAGRSIAGMFGADGLDADIGGAVGGGIGYVVGGPIGAGIGSFLGSMVGDFLGGLFENPSYPFARVQALMDAGGNVTFPSATSLDGGSELIPGLKDTSVAIMQTIASALQDLGIPMRQVSFPLGFDAGRPGSALGEGFFLGPPGNFENGAMFTRLSGQALFGKGVELGLGRIPAAVAKLAEQGVEIPSYETGGSPVFTSPTLIRVGERPEQVSVRHLGAAGAGGGDVHFHLGGAILDEISSSKFARTVLSQIEKFGRRGL